MKRIIPDALNNWILCISMRERSLHFSPVFCLNWKPLQLCTDCNLFRSLKRLNIRRTMGGFQIIPYHSLFQARNFISRPIFARDISEISCLKIAGQLIMRVVSCDFHGVNDFRDYLPKGFIHHFYLSVCPLSAFLFLRFDYRILPTMWKLADGTVIIGSYFLFKETSTGWLWHIP